MSRPFINSNEFPKVSLLFSKTVCEMNILVEENFLKIEVNSSHDMYCDLSI